MSRDAGEEMENISEDSVAERLQTSPTTMTLKHHFHERAVAVKY
jgi:hypothetical protein